MNDKQLKSKAVDIKGKKYVLVTDRVIFFNETYPNGSITTTLLSEPQEKHIVIKATVTPDTDKQNRVFSGMAQEVVGEGFINKTSALENAETSAVGRALAMMGIGVIDSIASVDEINKAKTSPQNSTLKKCACGNIIKGNYPNCFSCNNKDEKVMDKAIAQNDTDKKTIADLCKSLDSGLENKEDYESFVKDTTNLDLKPVNYADIITRLKETKKGIDGLSNAGKLMKQGLGEVH